MSQVWGSGEGQRQLARIALAMITMRADTPSGQWVEDTFGDTYFRLWDDAFALAGDDAREYMFLAMLNHASTWVQELAAATDRTVSEILAGEGRDIDAMRFEDDEDESGDGP